MENTEGPRYVGRDQLWLVKPPSWRKTGPLTNLEEALRGKGTRSVKPHGCFLKNIDIPS